MYTQTGARAHTHIAENVKKEKELFHFDMQYNTCRLYSIYAKREDRLMIEREEMRGKEREERQEKINR